jgi:hypothetical protein
LNCEEVPIGGSGVYEQWHRACLIHSLYGISAAAAGICSGFKLLRRNFMKRPDGGLEYAEIPIPCFRCLYSFCLSSLFFFLFGIPCAVAQPAATDLPLLHLSDFQFQGAFRLPAANYGNSTLDYSEGPLEYNPINKSVFIVGHTYQQAIAEFRVPALVRSSVLSELHMAGEPLQVFSSVMDRVAGGNPENIDRIGGMRLVQRPGGAQLIVNAYEYYDAPNDNHDTTFVVRDAGDLSNSQVDGFYRFPGVAHASGWISPVPSAWQSALGGSMITGNSSGMPIIGRLSVGPSAFVFNPLDLTDASPVPDPVPTTTLLDFNLAHPLNSDLSNSSRTNDIWTHLSRAVYGFIAPGTRTYVTLGQSGGHASGVCYKCTQNNGNLCGGYCAPDAEDYYLYYWLWDVNDLLKVKAGQMNAYDVRPYEYGEFPAVFNTSSLGGGSFDPDSGMLYLTLQRADDEQGDYDNPPVVAAYIFASDPQRSPRRAPADWDGDGKTDFTVVRSVGNYSWWYILRSKLENISAEPWGYPGQDVFPDLDLNGDGHCDQNAVRAASGSNPIQWFSRVSPDSRVSSSSWGEPGDVPISADFDGDRKDDITVWRSETGVWWVVLSQGGVMQQQWGLRGDYPVPDDFDGDGKTDFAVWRPSLGMWAVSLSSKHYSTALSDIIWQQWGLPDDSPMAGDYDGDKKADLVVWRNAGGYWFICSSKNSFHCSADSTAQQFGLPGDIPVKADFDGDGILDLAVWRPANGSWYWKQSSNGQVFTRQWGLPGDFPLSAGIRALVAQLDF